MTNVVLVNAAPARAAASGPFLATGVILSSDAFCARGGRGATHSAMIAKSARSASGWGPRIAWEARAMV